MKTKTISIALTITSGLILALLIVAQSARAAAPRPVAETPSPVSRLFEAKSRAEERKPAGDVELPPVPPPSIESPVPSSAEPTSAPSRRAGDAADEGTGARRR